MDVESCNCGNDIYTTSALPGSYQPIIKTTQSMASSSFVIRDGMSFNDVFHILKSKFDLPLQPDDVSLVDKDTRSYIFQTKYLMTYAKRYLVAAVKDFEKFADLDDFPKEVVSSAPSVQSKKRRQEIIRKRRVKAFNEELRKQVILAKREGGSIVTQGNSRQSISSPSRPPTSGRSAISTQEDKKIRQKVIDWQDNSLHIRLSQLSMQEQELEHDEEIHNAFTDPPDYIEEPTEIDSEVEEELLAAYFETPVTQNISPSGKRAIKPSLTPLPPKSPINILPSTFHQEETLYSPPAKKVNSTNANWGIYKPPDVDFRPARVYTKPPFPSSASKSSPPPQLPSSSDEMDENRKRKHQLVKSSAPQTTDNIPPGRPAKRQSPFKNARPKMVDPPRPNSPGIFATPNPISRSQENQRPIVGAVGDAGSFSTVSSMGSSSFQSDLPIIGTQPTSFGSTDCPGRYDDAVGFEGYVGPSRGRPNFASSSRNRELSQRTDISMESRPVMRQSPQPSDQLLRESSAYSRESCAYSVGTSVEKEMAELDGPGEPAFGRGHTFNSHGPKSASVTPLIPASPTPSPEKRAPGQASDSGNNQPRRAQKYRLYDTLGDEPFPGDGIPILASERTPYWLRYELTRLIMASSAKQCEPESLSALLESLIEKITSPSFDRRHIGKELSLFMAAFTPDETHLAERLYEDALAVISRTEGQWDDRIQLNAEMTLNTTREIIDTTRGTSRRIWRPVIQLKPLRLNAKSHRFGRHFGSHRFLTVRALKYDKYDNDVTKPGYEDYQQLWTELLCERGFKLYGYRWRPMYFHQAKGNIKKWNQVIMFAEEGPGITTMSVRNATEWFIPIEPNKFQTQCKWWSRIKLGFSTTLPTVVFEPDQIKPLPDIYSNQGNCLTDGCGLVSPAVLREVKRIHGLEFLPSAIQARIGSAKGLWVLDPDPKHLTSDELWIKIRPEQTKFNGISDDVAHRTLDIVGIASPLRSGYINAQFILILQQNNISHDALANLLREDLRREFGELLQPGRIEDPVFIRAFLEKISVNSSRRGVERLGMNGRVPSDLAERCINLLESGFNLTNGNLKDWFSKKLTRYFEKRKEKLHINIPKSCTVYCVADPSRKLKAGQVFLRFGQHSNFIDEKTLFPIDILIGDVLVTRNPAHTESDIQKVTAVDIPELRYLTNVIVFSADKVTCDRSLADYLSGGDYDGDRVWTCWEPRLVDPFQNKPFDPADTTPYIEVDKKKMLEAFSPKKNSKAFPDFVRTQIQLSLEESLLGKCTSFYYALVYKKANLYHDSMNDPEAKILAALCSKLVDGPKHGFRVRETCWKGLCRTHNGLPEPLYKKKNLKSSDVTNAKTSQNPMDRLRFQVAETEITSMLESFEKLSEGAVCKDKDILRCYDDFWNYYEKQKNEWEKKRNTDAEDKYGDALAVLGQLKRLNAALDPLYDKWNNHFKGRISDDDLPLEDDRVTAGNQNLVDRLLDEYLNMKPIIGDPGLKTTSLIEYWALTADNVDSDWSRIRAAALHRKVYSLKTTSSPFPWYMAGDVFCRIKSVAVSPHEPPRSMTASMAFSLKVRSSALVKPEQIDWGSGIMDDYDDFDYDD
ncbi:hypothetical protein H072_6215 [Dactylellina haptotyla CBS 200.50]|uniref:RDRP core domain-containing protein n=1 Tax=Dactylellina haptotyla (strain CBS 200.50) TaxID=1284197 RepID=S8AAM5_DACHA|nr:hypothetical protein H072_6215 [Dactylellina haptotyla CBS 200.50]